MMWGGGMGRGQGGHSGVADGPCSHAAAVFSGTDQVRPGSLSLRA